MNKKYSNSKELIDDIYSALRDISVITDMFIVTNNTKHPAFTRAKDATTTLQNILKKLSD